MGCTEAQRVVDHFWSPRGASCVGSGGAGVFAGGMSQSPGRTVKASAWLAGPWILSCWPGVDAAGPWEKFQAQAYSRGRGCLGFPVPASSDLLSPHPASSHRCLPCQGPWEDSVKGRSTRPVVVPEGGGLPPSSSRSQDSAASIPCPRWAAGLTLPTEAPEPLRSLM